MSSQQITLDVDRDAARRLGVEMSDVTQALNNAFGQRQVSTIYNALNQYRVVMEVAPEYAQGPEALDRVYVIAGGQRIPLSTFSKYQHTVAPDRVSHCGQFASTSIDFELPPGVSLSQAQAAIDRAVGAARRCPRPSRGACRATRACSSRRRATSRSPSSARC